MGGAAAYARQLTGFQLTGFQLTGFQLTGFQLAGFQFWVPRGLIDWIDFSLVVPQTRDHTLAHWATG